MRRPSRPWFLALSAALLAGCVGGSPELVLVVGPGPVASGAPAEPGAASAAPAAPSAAPVLTGGQARLKGMPLGDAAVAIFAADGDQPIATAKTDAQGRFAVPAAALPADKLLRVVATGGTVTLAGTAIVSAGGSNIVGAGGSNIVSAGGSNIVGAGGSNIVGAGGSNIVSAGGSNYVVLGLLDDLVLDEPGTLAYVALGPQLFALAASDLTPEQTRDALKAFDDLRGEIAKMPREKLDAYTQDLSAAVADAGTAGLPAAIAGAIEKAVPGFAAAVKGAGASLTTVAAAAAVKPPPPADPQPPVPAPGNVESGGSGGSGGGGADDDDPVPTPTPVPPITGQIR